MVNQHYSRTKQAKKKSTARLVIFLVLLLAVAVLGVFSATQYLAVQAMQREMQSLEDKFDEVKQENEHLQEQYEEIYEENEKLREENRMLRSSTVIEHGNRETDKVAITIDDGAGAELINRALDHLKAHDVRATLFPMGSWIDHAPEVWQRAVEEGHELGNHTYNHPYITQISEERIREELSGWQESVEEAVGEPHRTLFFRPPYGDGFMTGQGHHQERLQEIIAKKGMFPVLWDVELIYALRNESYSSARITEHVLANARGGSIVLLHFNEEDINALPNIITGLRDRGLEPCSLSELLLAEP